MSNVKLCPNCMLRIPEETEYCDCGYDFGVRTVVTEALMDGKTTQELFDIYQEKDGKKWSVKSLELAKKILLKREQTLPSKDKGFRSLKNLLNTKDSTGRLAWTKRLSVIYGLFNFIASVVLPANMFFIGRPDLSVGTLILLSFLDGAIIGLIIDLIRFLSKQLFARRLALILGIVGGIIGLIIEGVKINDANFAGSSIVNFIFLPLLWGKNQFIAGLILGVVAGIVIGGILDVATRFKHKSA